MTAPTTRFTPSGQGFGIRQKTSALTIEGRLRRLALDLHWLGQGQMRPRLPGADRSYAQPNFMTMKGEDMRTLARLWKEEEGQDLIEYVLLVALIALAGLVGFPGLGNQIATIFNNVSQCLNSASASNSGANC